MSLRSSLLLQCLSRPGPSRLANRIHPCPSCLNLSRCASTTSDPQSSPEPPVESAADDAPTAEVKSAETEEPEVFDDSPGYKTWLRTVGIKYRDPPENGPNWLGGKETPFATNPSFRPPTPLSDMLREMIYMDSLPVAPIPFLNNRTPSGEIRGAAKTIPQLSEKYGISKARVEAILKLKAMEKEWEKQGKVLQTPFNTAMEKYLAVRLPRPRNSPNTSSPRTEEAERSYRALHPSSTLERAQESEHDSVIAEHGDSDNTADVHDKTVFSKRDTLTQAGGVDRAAWEFRGEETVDEELGTPHNPLARHGSEKAQASQSVSHMSAGTISTFPGKTTMTFVDVGKSQELKKEYLERHHKHDHKSWIRLRKKEKLELARTPVRSRRG